MDISDDDHRLNALQHMDEARRWLVGDQAAVGHALLAIAEAQYAQWELLVEIRNALRDIKR